MIATADESGMVSSMFDTSHLAEVALRTLIVYFALLLAMRLAGKREVGQLKPFDLVTLLIISNALQNAMVGPDSSLVGGLTAAGVILGVNYVVSALRSRYAAAQQLFEGSPSLIVHDGKFVADHMRREGLSEADVLQAMREHGVDDLSQVKDAVLEVDGSISIVPTENTSVTRTRRRFRRQPHQ
jgi:uncharacterized membrane protein YcaP (DUF421 family)